MIVHPVLRTFRRVKALFVAPIGWFFLAVASSAAQDLKALNVAAFDVASLTTGTDITDNLVGGREFFLFAEFAFEDLATLEQWKISWFWDEILIQETTFSNEGGLLGVEEDESVTLVVPGVSFTAAQGRQSLKVVVDIDDRVEEDDEENNEFVRTFRVAEEIEPGPLLVFDAPRDFDGDGAADLAVFFRPGPRWFLFQSTAGFLEVPLGSLESAFEILGDFDGDGRTDIGIFEPGGGRWSLLQSAAGFRSEPFGFSTNVPVPGDYDGDTITDLAVFDLPTATWFIFGSGSGFTMQQFGFPGVMPVPLDYDGDGRTDIALYDPGSGNWFVLGSAAGFFTQPFGAAGDIAVPGFYDGDAVADLAVFDPGTGTWFIQGSAAGLSVQQFGFPGVYAVPADYDGDGRTDIAVYALDGGLWFLFQSTAGFAVRQFGFSQTPPVGVSPF